MSTPVCNRRSPSKHWKLVFALASTVPLQFAGSPESYAQPLPVDEARWQVSIAAEFPTYYIESDFNDHVPVGLELGLSYRISRRVGVGLTALQHDFEEEYEFNFFDEIGTIQTTYRPLWLLAHTDFHLTPDRRVDLILSPMVGVVQTGDIRVETLEQPVAFEARVDTQEDLAWGARLALDIPLGQTPGRSSLTVGLTYLTSHVEVSTRSSGDGLEEIELDFYPMSAHVGFAYRF